MSEDAQPEATKRGLFICLEGGEGSGKTTMVRTVKDYLSSQGREVIEMTDPGSTPLALALRAIVVDAHVPCTPHQQALLYIAARDALADEVSHYLDIGTDVVCGRWTLSTIIYQGLLGQVGVENVEWLAKNFVGIDPDIYIVLNATPEIALARKQAAVGAQAMFDDRFDGRPIEWHRKIQDTYYMLAQEAGYPIVDADKPLTEVQKAVISVCQTHHRFRAVVPCAAHCAVSIYRCLATSLRRKASTSICGSLSAIVMCFHIRWDVV